MARDSMTKEEDGKEKGGKEKIVAAIRRAAAELGRAPSRGELRRITGVSHYRVLAEFPTLREAVRAAGLEPNPKGEKISTEDLLADWKRVAEKLGRRPSRAEYVREGRYSAGALTVRFGSWGKIGENPLTTEDTKEHGGKTKSSRESYIRNTHQKTRIDSQKLNGSGERETQRLNSGQLVLRGFDRVPLAAVPSPLVGMRKVTESVAQMVVNTLMGNGYWPLAVGQNQKLNPFTTEVTEEHGGERSGDLVIGRSGDLRSGSPGEPSPQLQNLGLSLRGVDKESDLDPSLTVKSPLVQDDGLRRGDFAPRGVDRSKPVMGEPFDRSPMTNAPVNELGVMVLFGMVAARLGLQVESVQGKFPDCVAKRLVAPGKWQHLRIEFEYESKNFKLHGHDPKGCDMIVCWRHNWKECPEGIEVVELCRLFGM